MISLYPIFVKTGAITAIVTLLIASSNIFSWILATQQVPVLLRDFMVSVTDSRSLILLMMIACYLVMGCFLDLTPAMIILVPIFLPLVNQLQINLIHFGLITCMSLGIGLYTPPVGACLAVGLAISKEPLIKVSIAVIPFLLTMLVVLLLITFFPGITLFLLSFKA